MDDRYGEEEDPYAKSFFDSDNEFMFALINGNTIDAAFKRSFDRYTRMSDSWARWLEANPDADPETRARVLACIKLLLHDRNSFELFGSRTIYSAMPLWPLLIALGAGAAYHYLTRRKGYVPYEKVAPKLELVEMAKRYPKTKI